MSNFFSKNNSFIFYYNTSTNFKSVFCRKTKVDSPKECLKRREPRAPFCFHLGSLHFSEKKLLTTTVLLVQELMKQKKLLVFGPPSTLIFSIFRQREKVNNIYGKTFALVHLNSYNENMYMAAILKDFAKFTGKGLCLQRVTLFKKFEILSFTSK